VIQKGTRIMRLEKRIRSLDMIDDDESNSFTEDEGNVSQSSADDPKLVPSHMSDDLGLHLQSRRGSILSNISLDTPVPYSTRGGSIFSQESSSTCDAASSLLRESSMRATMLLQKTASRAAPVSIMEEEEDNKSQGTSASDSVSVASGLLRESRLRAMKMLEKTAPRAAAESSEDGDEDLR